MKVHAAIASALADNGVDTLFGLIGDANLFLVDSFVREGRGRFFSGAHEAGVVLMASGYAGATGRVGVATVTHGPALTNTMTPLVEGVKNRSPLVVIAGDTAVIDTHNLQNVAQREIVLSTGAGFEQVRAPHTVVFDVATALRRAAVERRPVVLNVPVEFQWEEIAYERVDLLEVAPQAVGPDPDTLDAAVGLLATARRPIVLAGRGAIGARAAIVRLAERLGAPLATTLKAKDLFRGNPFDLGIFGTLSTPPAVDAIGQSDCVLAFGAGLNRWTTADGAHLEGKRVVHCDVERAALGQFARADVAILGDAAVVADTIVAWLDEADLPRSGFRSAPLSEALSSWPSDAFEDASTDSSVDLRAALHALEASVPAERVLVLDGGRFVFEAFVRLRVETPSLFQMTVNYGSIGLGMGTAIGAAHGLPGRPVLLVTGDGGFMLGGITEFATAVRHGIDLIVAVCNDSAYGAEHIQFRERDMDPGLATFAWPDLAPVAESLGGQGYTVRNPEDLSALAEVIGSRSRPLLIDFKLDPDRVPNSRH